MQLFLWIFALAIARAHADDIDSWLAQEKGAAVQLLMRNVSPTGCARGAVIASPSQNRPNYFFHWVRDGSLVMNVVTGLYEQARNPSEKLAFRQSLVDFIEFSRRNQLTPNPSGGADDLGLGEPKFNCSGTAFTGPWGRPQNDGPALRAIALTRFARDLIAEGQVAFVRQKLYDSALPSRSVIKLDLEFVAHHWMEASFDLWEEVKGKHFYTQMVQRRALLEGALLAQTLGDPGAAAFYRQQAQALEPEIRNHWDAGRGFVVETLGAEGGIQGKSGLDAGVILGALHGCVNDGFFCPGDPKIMATARVLEQTFARIYPISQLRRNRLGDPMDIPIGRYPEDTYSGEDARGEGNPWFLLTNAFAELYMKVGQADKARGFLRRVRFHSGGGPSLSEQYNRHTGTMQSAHDLTWSYASVLTVPSP